MRKINPLFTIAIVFFVTASAYLGYNLAFQNLILPKIKISNIEVGGLSRDSALAKLNKAFISSPNSITISYDGKSLSPLVGLEVKRDFEWAVDQALKIGRSGDFFQDNRDRIERVYKNRDVLIPLHFEESDLDEIINSVSLEIEVQPIWPKIEYLNQEFKIRKGSEGLVVKKSILKEQIRAKLAFPSKQDINIVPEKVVTTEDSALVENALRILNNWGNDKLQIRYKEFNLLLEKNEVAELFGLTTEKSSSEVLLPLVQKIKEKIETEPKDAVFEFEEGRVKEFKPEIIGVLVDLPKFKTLLEEEVLSGKTKDLEVPVILNYPKVRTGDINNMGIKELIGVGKSSFGHSIPGRVFNVNLAATRINGVVVSPGEEFSFNKSVGEISRATGYQTAYVISEGKTVLGDGGGVCQVSTTTFRAAMDAGLPIVERRAHAYRVGYYEQDSAPGIDATIFSPSTDFKFLNDTGHHILIQSKVDTKNLTMRVEIYGTSDGRSSEISKPIITSQSPAPATVYVDDPSLPKGTTKQIDWSAPGAKVSFDYKVERGGEVLFEKKFLSNYQPWRAVYLVGTGN